MTEAVDVTIVDNASSDGSADDLQCGFPIQVLRNSGNEGFAAACNQGAASSKAEFLLFLNFDIEVTAEALRVPIEYMRDPRNADVGICGVQLVDETGAVLRTCARFPSAARLVARSTGLDRFLPAMFPPHYLAEWDHGDTREVDEVMGAFYFVRRSTFEELNGFDERYFVFFEEVDFAFRAKVRGWRTMYLANAQVCHLGHEAKRPSAPRLYYVLRSRIIYSHAHFRRASAVIVAFSTLWLEPIARLILAAAARSPGQLKATGRAYRLLWQHAGSLLLGRMDATAARSPFPPVRCAPESGGSRLIRRKRRGKLSA